MAPASVTIWLNMKESQPKAATSATTLTTVAESNTNAAIPTESPINARYIAMPTNAPITVQIVNLSDP